MPLLIGLGLLLSACATDYNSSILQGVDSTKTGANDFTIDAIGNAYTTIERAEDLAMLEAAVVTLKNGHDVFEVMHLARRGTDWVRVGSPRRPTAQHAQHPRGQDLSAHLRARRRPRAARSAGDRRAPRARELGYEG